MNLPSKTYSIMSIYLRNILTLIITTIICTGFPNTATGETFNPESLYRQWHDSDINSLRNRAKQYDLSNAPDSALVCYTIISDRLSSKDNATDNELRNLALAENNLGYIYGSYYSDYTRALRHICIAEKVGKKVNYTVNLAYTALNKGGVYLACNRIYGNSFFADEIWECTSQGIEYALKSEEWNAALGGIVNLTIIYMDNPRPAQFTELAERIFSSPIPESTPLYDFSKAMTQGTIAASKGDYKAAAQAYDTAGDLVSTDDMQWPRLMTIALAARAEALSRTGDNHTALEVTLRWRDIARQHNLGDELADSYYKLCRYYTNIGDKSSANDSMLEYYATKDSVLTGKDVAAIGNLPFLDKIDGLNNEIRQERTRLNRILTISIVTGCIVLLLALYVIQLVRSRRKLREYSREIYRKYVESLQTADETKARDKKYSSSPIPETSENDILAKIAQVMENNELISNPDFSLTQLSEIIGYSYKQVSQTINDKLQKNFKTLLAETRIREACNRLLDQDTYGQYTIEHVAHSVGFASRSNFSVVFKSVVGITPAEFRRNAIEAHSH